MRAWTMIVLGVAGCGPSVLVGGGDGTSDTGSTGGSTLGTGESSPWTTGEASTSGHAPDPESTTSEGGTARTGTGASDGSTAGGDSTGGVDSGGTGPGSTGPPSTTGHAETGDSGDAMGSTGPCGTGEAPTSDGTTGQGTTGQGTTLGDDPPIPGACLVPTDYGTIQAAIDDTSCGVVHVAAGDFDEYLVIRRPVIVIGAGPSQVFVGGSPGAGSRVVVNAPLEEVVLEGFTIRDGRAATGGGVLVQAGYLSLNSVHVVDNVASSEAGEAVGGGVAVLGGALRLQNSEIRSNRALARGAEAMARGGGVYANGAVVSVGDSSVVDNRVECEGAGARPVVAHGGGVYVSHAWVSLSRTRVANNVVFASAALASGSAGQGGGVWASGEVSCTECVVESNRIVSDGNAEGGGVYLGGSLRAVFEMATVRHNAAVAAMGGELGSAAGGGVAAFQVLEFVRFTNSRISSNRVSSGAQSVAAGGGVALFADDGTLVVESTTLDGNHVESGAEGRGGAIAMAPLDAPAELGVSMRNATVYDNWIEGSHGTGGGLDALLPETGVVLIQSSTIAHNRSPAGGGVMLRAPDDPPPGDAVRVTQTILANNTAFAGRQCGLEGVTWTSWGHNLIDDLDGCGLEVDPTSDQVGLDPRLCVLAENGGPTPTCALRSGSPAIDGGVSSGCVPVDQRGLPRPAGGACDVGAFEVQ